MFTTPAPRTCMHSEDFAFRGHNGCESRCRMRVCSSPDLVTVYVATELDDNPGTSVTNAAEWLALQALQHYSPRMATYLGQNVVNESYPAFWWVEHYLPNKGLMIGHRYDLVLFHTQRIYSQVFREGVRLGEAEWLPLSRDTLREATGIMDEDDPPWVRPMRLDDNNARRLLLSDAPLALWRRQ